MGARKGWWGSGAGGQGRSLWTEPWMHETRTTQKAGGGATRRMPTPIARLSIPVFKTVYWGETEPVWEEKHGGWWWVRSTVRGWEDLGPRLYQGLVDLGVVFWMWLDTTERFAVDEWRDLVHNFVPVLQMGNQRLRKVSKLPNVTQRVSLRGPGL